MKKRYLDASDIDKNWLLDYSTHYEYLKDQNAYIAFIHINEVKFNVFVDYNDSDEILISNGYKCLMYMPIDKNWCLSVFTDSKLNVKEWYFDITKDNNVDSRGIPFYTDMFLDVVVDPNMTIEVLDKDELDSAVEMKLITHDEYETTIKTSEELINSVINKSEFMYDYINMELQRLSKG